MDFYKRLGIVCRAIPKGKVITYGQAALLCGFPKNATLRLQGFLFSVQELLPKSRQNRESTSSYSRCRFIGWLKKLAALPWGADRRSQCAHWLRNDAARNRMTRRCVLLPTFPAVGKSGPPEARSLCRRVYWKKVTVGDKRGTNCPTSALRTSLLPSTHQIFTNSSYFSGFVKIS